MKKMIFLLIALGAEMCCYAQKGLQIGILGGPQSTWLLNKNDSDDRLIKFENGWRGLIGASLDYHFTNTIGIGTELVYSWQGQNLYVPAGVLETREVHYKKIVNYFKIPVLFSFNSDPSAVAMFMGKFGPSFGFVTNAKGEYPGQPDVDIKYQYKSYNIGVLLGMGVGFNIKKTVIIDAGIRIDGGATDAMVANPVSAKGNNLGGYVSYYDSDTHTTDANRKKTWNLAGGVEVGVKYIIKTHKK